MYELYEYVMSCVAYAINVYTYQEFEQRQNVKTYFQWIGTNIYVELRICHSGRRAMLARHERWSSA